MDGWLKACSVWTAEGVTPDEAFAQASGEPTNASATSPRENAESGLERPPKEWFHLPRQASGVKPI